MLIIQRRRWTRARQVAFERPRYPSVPACCPRCGARFAMSDQDGDWSCFTCGELLVCWSRYHREIRRWRKGAAAIRENGLNHGGLRIGAA